MSIRACLLSPPSTAGRFSARADRGCGCCPLMHWDNDGGDYPLRFWDNGGDSRPFTISTLQQLVRSCPGTLKELGSLGSGTLLERDLP